MDLFIKTENKKKRLIGRFNPIIKINNKNIMFKTASKSIKRKSISAEFAGRKIIRESYSKPRSRGKSFTKDEINALHVTELKEIFNKSANKIGFTTVGRLFETLSENNHYAEDSDFLFHEFNFEKDKKINFNQFMEYMNKRRSDNGYSLQRNGEVVYLDPIQNCKKTKKINPGALKIMFSQFDKNHDGVLSMDELIIGLRKDFNTPTIQEMFKEYDKDKNNVLDIDEFISLFKPEKMKMERINKKSCTSSLVL